MPVVAALRYWPSIHRVFASTRDFCRRFQPRLKTVDFECSSAARQRVKKRKRTRKRSRRSRAKTHTPLTTLKQKRGGCLSAASFRVKRQKSFARASKQQALTRQ